MAHQVALIMRSKNEQPYTEHALRALKSQTFHDFVLYNVDSGSTDGTLEVIRKFNANQANIVLISPEDYIPGKVLNMMIERSQESIIVFLNADAIPLDSEWLERLLSPILNGKADATMSRQVARKDGYFIVDYDYIRAYDEINLARNPCFFSAAACAFKRELWEQTKFYDEGISEDLLWSKICQEKGAIFKYVPDSVVEHSHNYTLKQLYRRHYGEGKAFSHIFGEKPSLFRELFSLGKELVRDFFYSISKGQIHTIPYNIIYRCTIHLAQYRGKKSCNFKV